MSIFDAERFVESAYRAVTGIYPQQRIAPEPRSTLSGGLDATQHGASSSGSLSLIRSGLAGSFDLAVLETKYNTNGSISHIIVVADRVKADGEMRRDIAHNLTMDWAKLEKVDIEHLADATGLKIGTIKNYRSRTRKLLEQYRESACVAAYDLR